MIKGVNKCVIEVADTQDKYFERAILFVRPEYADKKAEILREKAKEYVASVGTASPAVSMSFALRRKCRRRTGFILWLTLGLLAAAAVIIGYMLIV